MEIHEYLVEAYYISGKNNISITLKYLVSIISQTVYIWLFYFFLKGSTSNIRRLDWLSKSSNLKLETGVKYYRIKKNKILWEIS